MDLQKKLIAHTRTLLEPPSSSPTTIVVGLSGGSDSVFLLHLFVQMPEVRIIAAHLNHGWRDDADDDEAFCRNLTERLGCEVVTDHARAYAAIDIPPTGSREAVGRAMRRRFFAKVAQQYQASYIALAHHADDQEETLLLRLIRGSSLAGLTCMHAKNGRYLRPLLNTRKAAILNYLAAHRISYRDDKTNQSSDFLRNRIRHSVIPALHACDSRSHHKILSTVAHLNEAEAELERITEVHYRMVFTALQSTTGSLVAFRQLSVYMQKRLLIHLLCTANVPFSPSNAHLEEMRRFLYQTNGGTHTMHATWRLWKKKQEFGIQKNI